MKSTREKFLHELNDAYDAEQQFHEAMDEMHRAVGDATLGQLLDEHISQTQEHIGWLDEVFTKVGSERKQERRDGAKGIVTEGRKVIRETKEGALRDTVIASALRKAEHYEIAGYQSLVAGAESMGDKDVTRLLNQILDQEQTMADRLLKAAPNLLRKASQADATGTEDDYEGGADRSRAGRA